MAIIKYKIETFGQTVQGEESFEIPSLENLKKHLQDRFSTYSLIEARNRDTKEVIYKKENI